MRTQQNIIVKLAALFSVALFAMLSFAPAVVGAQSVSDEARFIALINNVRSDQGLAPLTQNNQLTNLSRGWAQAQRDGVCGEGNYICHANPISEGVTQDWAKLGENVGTGGDVDDVMTAFINSPSHYENIIDPAFTHIGVGVVWDGNRLYTTHRFMDLNDAAPATTTTTTAPTTTTAAPRVTAAPTTAAPTTAAPVTAAPAAPSPAPSTTAPFAVPFAAEDATSPVAPAEQDEIDSDESVPAADDNGTTDELAGETPEATADVSVERVAVLVNALATLPS